MKNINAKQLLRIAAAIFVAGFIMTPQLCVGKTKIGNLVYELNKQSKEAIVIGYDKKIPPTGKLIIPSTISDKSGQYAVTGIGARVFRECRGITSLELPATLKSIDIYAFAYCTGLAELLLPNSGYTIGEYAFLGCTGLRSLSVPNGIKSISWNAFEGCTGVTSVDCDRNITGDWLALLPNLQKLSIGKNVKEVSNGVIQKCKKLTDLSINCEVVSIENDRVNQFNPSWFYNTGIKHVTLGENVKILNEGAFMKCYNLETIDMSGSSVEVIKRKAFEDCTSLREVKLSPALTTIGPNAFYFCEKLQSIFIPDKVEYLPQGVFEICKGLEMVSYPSTLEIDHEKVFGTGWHVNPKLVKRMVTGSDDYLLSCSKAVTLYDELQKRAIAVKVDTTGLYNGKLLLEKLTDKNLNLKQRIDNNDMIQEKVKEIGRYFAACEVLKTFNIRSTYIRSVPGLGYCIVEQWAERDKNMVARPLILMASASPQSPFRGFYEYATKNINNLSVELNRKIEADRKSFEQQVAADKAASSNTIPNFKKEVGSHGRLIDSNDNYTDNDYYIFDDGTTICVYHKYLRGVYDYYYPSKNKEFIHYNTATDAARAGWVYEKKGQLRTVGKQ